MAKSGDLEIGLSRLDHQEFRVDLRYLKPDSETYAQIYRHAGFRPDFDALRACSDGAEYGRRLTDAFFAEDALRASFVRISQDAESLDTPLRVRLHIDPNAEELHALLWETLCDPTHQQPLFTTERFLFSRFLSGLNQRRVKLASRGEMRALVVIANPTNLDEYSLAPINGPMEQRRAELGLDGLALTMLQGPEANMENIACRLREGVDVVYLVCHGSMRRDQPYLWLCGEDGRVQHVPGTRLSAVLHETARPPRLMMLISCQSAGTGKGDERPLAALGPTLAAAGIPAVLAMQGQISMDTMDAFLPRFFQELDRDGQIDLALARARGAVRERSDWWMPVLFQRLKSGRLWYTAGFGEGERMDKWPTVLRQIKKHNCTPILGHHLTDELLGSRADLAQRWAVQFGFPMGSDQHDNFARVAQFLAVNQSATFPHDEWVEQLGRRLTRAFGESCSDWPAHGDLEEQLEVLMDAGEVANPYASLAELPFPVYFSADPSNLLELALQGAGKEPEVMCCPWQRDCEPPESVFEDEPGFKPTPERPLIFKLLGRFDDPDTLVLTEDDFFEYLIGITENRELMPPVVRKALSDRALMMLGFELDAWDFRVLFRSLLNMGRGGRRGRYPNLAAQIDPENHDLHDAERARRYLESYFGQTHISIFWGGAADFLQLLSARWREANR